VIEVSDWIEQHPGGAYSIEVYLGKDATAAFMGGESVHPDMPRAFHSDYAKSLVQTKAVARITYEMPNTRSNSSRLLSNGSDNI